jgi:hypothetical protein
LFFFDSDTDSDPDPDLDETQKPETQKTLVPFAPSCEETTCFLSRLSRKALTDYARAAISNLLFGAVLL